MINTYRSQNGAGPLVISPELNRSAAWMVVDMGTKGYFAHTDSLGRSPWTRIADCGYSAAAGENLAAGTNRSTAQSAFELFRGSPSHNQNMLEPDFRFIGIARAHVEGSTYNWYWATTFGYDPRPAPPPPAPAPPAPAPAAAAPAAPAPIAQVQSQAAPPAPEPVLSAPPETAQQPAPATDPAQDAEAGVARLTGTGEKFHFAAGLVHHRVAKLRSGQPNRSNAPHSRLPLTERALRDAIGRLRTLQRHSATGTPAGD